MCSLQTICSLYLCVHSNHLLVVAVCSPKSSAHCSCVFTQTICSLYLCVHSNHLLIVAVCSLQTICSLYLCVHPNHPLIVAVCSLQTICSLYLCVHPNHPLIVAVCSLKPCGYSCIHQGSAQTIFSGGNLVSLGVCIFAMYLYTTPQSRLLKYG